MKQTQKTIDDFALDLSGKDPVPGGGGAAAVAGALGAALGSMVASLTIGKEKYRDVEAELAILKVRVGNIRNQLLELADKDASVFLALMEVYKMPKDTEEEKRSRGKAMESALRAAAEVPLDIMRRSCEAITLMEDFARKGSKLAISDSGCGVILCKTALQSAWLNVLINTGSMADREYAKSINNEGRALLKEYLTLADNIYASVEKALL